MYYITLTQFVQQMPILSWLDIFNFFNIQSTPANPDTEGTGLNRLDIAESGLAGVKCINLDGCSCWRDKEICPDDAEFRIGRSSDRPESGLAGVDCNNALLFMLFYRSYRVSAVSISVLLSCSVFLFNI